MKGNIRYIFIITMVLIILTFIVYTFIINYTMSEHISKESIIKVFNNNSNEFNAIARYIDTMDGLFTFYYDYDKNICISKNNSNGTEVEIKIDDTGLRKNLDYLIKELKFSYVLEGKDYILFIRERSDYEQGIMFLKSGGKTGGFDKEIQISGNWYYYLKTYV